MRKKRSCLNCSRMAKNHKDILRYYYLNRPIDCAPEMFNKKNNPDGYTPESFAEECERYTTDEIFQDENGTRRHWLRQENGEIRPWDPDFSIHTWFSRGFMAAIEAIGGLPPSFKKKCGNCEHSNKHIYNRCEGVKVCEKWELDWERAFDNKYFGNLCDSCTVKECGERRTIWSDFPRNFCKKWKKPPKESRRKPRAKKSRGCQCQ